MLALAIIIRLWGNACNKHSLEADRPNGRKSGAKCCLIMCVWASIATPTFAQQAARPIANVAPALTPERLRVTGGGSVSATLSIGAPQTLPPDAKRRWAVVRRV